MATEIRVPTLGESVTEATIGKWFKKPGDAVRQDEPLVELETDKVTLEVNAPASGTLAEIVAKDGDTVGVGALLGQISAGAALSRRLPRPPRPRPLPSPPPRRPARARPCRPQARRRQGRRPTPASRPRTWPAPASAARC
jgi:2-oxoglutarate dehydrogenase E2 component (dihydrolipoamide succinyltransferase)